MSRKKIDAEADIIGQVAEALEPLDKHAKMRIINYFANRTIREGRLNEETVKTPTFLRKNQEETVQGIADLETKQEEMFERTVFVSPKIPSFLEPTSPGVEQEYKRLGANCPTSENHIIQNATTPLTPRL